MGAREKPFSYLLVFAFPYLFSLVFLWGFQISILSFAAVRYQLPLLGQMGAFNGMRTMICSMIWVLACLDMGRFF